MNTGGSEMVKIRIFFLMITFLFLGCGNFPTFEGEGVLFSPDSMKEDRDLDAHYRIKRGGTAVAIGPQVLLTAAHNVVGKGRLAITGLEMTCEKHKSYVRREGESGNSADVALCLVTGNALRKPHEVVNLEASHRKGDEVVVTSYCQKAGVRGTGFCERRSKVLELPTGQGFHFMKVDACVTPGNSGGAVFDGRNPARVFAVVAERHCRDCCARVSSLVTMNDWVLKWIDRNNALVCGVSENVPDCRS